MICLLAAGIAIPLGTSALTLRWMHSVEKTAWEEDWQSRPDGLTIVAARVKGSGAGMDPAPDARLVKGAWNWTPQVPHLQEVVLRRSGATADWSICIRGRCRPMDSYVSPGADPVALTLCPAASRVPEPSPRSRVR